MVRGAHGGPRHNWKDEQRVALHVLRSEFDYSIEDNARIFNHVFADDLSASGYTKGMTGVNLRDEYNGRLLSGRSKAWLWICQKKQSKEQVELREQFKQRIEEAAALLVQGQQDDTVKEEAVGGGEEAVHAEEIGDVRKKNASPLGNHEGVQIAPGHFDSLAMGAGSELYQMRMRPLLDAQQLDHTHSQGTAPAASSVTKGSKKRQRHSNPYNNSEFTVNKDYVDYHPDQKFREVESGRYMVVESNDEDPPQPKRTKKARTTGPEALNNDVEHSDLRKVIQTAQDVARTGSGDEHSTNLTEASALGSAPKQAKEKQPEPRESLATVFDLTDVHQELNDKRQEFISDEQAPDTSATRVDSTLPPVDASSTVNITPLSKITTSLTAGSAGPALQIIHHSATSTTWKDNTPHSPSSAFVVRRDEAIFNSGKVFRGVIDGETQDVVVCNKQQCGKCLFAHIKKGRFAIAGASPTNGLPYVHTSDLQHDPKSGFHFQPQHRAYNTVFPWPQHMWKTSVTFWDGMKREVMVCNAKKCEECPDSEAAVRDKGISKMH